MENLNFLLTSEPKSHEMIQPKRKQVKDVFVLSGPGVRSWRLE